MLGCRRAANPTSYARREIVHAPRSTGSYFEGGTCGPAVNLPVPVNEQNNPDFHGCLDRNA